MDRTLVLHQYERESLDNDLSAIASIGQLLFDLLEGDDYRWAYVPDLGRAVEALARRAQRLLKQDETPNMDVAQEVPA